MRTQIFITLAICSASLLVSCNSGNSAPDCSGNFEAEEILVSAEGTGKIMAFQIEEGEILDSGQVVGYIDTTQLHLKKVQLRSMIGALRSKLPDIGAQIDVLNEQLATARYEKARIERLVKVGAATGKQLDDLNAQIALLDRQKNAMQSSLSIQTTGTLAEIEPLRAQIAQIDDQITKSVITNPTRGTVLSKYARQSEFTTTGKPLYKLADVETITLQAYITGEELHRLKIGEKLDVAIDSSQGGYRHYEGLITWVANKAEFTPKVIQTKNERVNLVYAFKVKVQNDGAIKIGMPGEVRFEEKRESNGCGQSR